MPKAVSSLVRLLEFDGLWKIDLAGAGQVNMNGFLVIGKRWSAVTTSLVALLTGFETIKVHRI